MSGNEGYPDTRESAGRAGPCTEGRASAGREETRSPERSKSGRRTSPEDRWTRRDREKQEEKGKIEEAAPQASQQVNLMTLVGLVRWVEKSIKKIGKERVEAIVEIYRTAGYLPSSYNDTIPQIIRLAEDEKPEGPVSMGDSINVLLQLDNLLGGKFKAESAVLATLFGEEGGYPWTKQ